MPTNFSRPSQRPSSKPTPARCGRCWRTTSAPSAIKGYILDKAQWLGKFADFSYTSLQSIDVDVNCYDRAAIVRYVQCSASVWRGQQMTSTTRVSQTWIQQADGWRLAGIQFSTLSEA